MAFTVHAVMPGVWHIVDCMGVCMTLLEGENAAMLVDTGYGIEDVADFMRHMTDLPLTVFLTHNHHDHAMGARCFPETYMLEADMADWRMFTDDKMRRRVLTQAIGKTLPVDEKTFLAGEIPLPKVMKPGVIDLGGLTAEIIEAPGHTPGSAVVYVPERKLLLSGDDWNPCTWLFFPQALGLREYRSNMRGIQQLLDHPSHQGGRQHGGLGHRADHRVDLRAGKLRLHGHIRHAGAGRQDKLPQQRIAAVVAFFFQFCPQHRGRL